MQTIAEISKYPLDKDYDGPILDFITRLKDYEELDIKVGPTSTVLIGEFGDLMLALQKEMEVSFQQPGRCVFVLKLLNTDVKERSQEITGVSSSH